MKRAFLIGLAHLLVSSLLVACGTSQAERDSQATQIAAEIFATQTAKAPTLTPVPPPTSTPIPTNTLAATPIPPTTTPIPFTPTPVSPTPTPTSVPLGDTVKVGLVTIPENSDFTPFNELTWNGMQKAQQDFGVEINFLEAQHPNYDQPINTFIQQNYDLIITIGFLPGESTQAAAEANPNVSFAVVDFSPASAPNILKAQFAVDEAGVLAGYLAAGVSKTEKVGTFGAFPILPILQYMVGYEQGVNYYNQVHGTSIEVLGWSTETRTGDFIDSVKGYYDPLDQDIHRKFAETLFDEGADIVMPLAYNPGMVTTADIAKNRGLMVIGIEHDYYNLLPEFSEVLLTSIIKRSDVVAYEATKAVVEGIFEGGVRNFNLANGGVDLASYHDQAYRVSPELQAELDQLKAAIIAGQISTGWDQEKFLPR